jgi:hypothetical protein
MNFLRRLQAETPVLFWVLVILALFLGFQLLLALAAVVLGPFGLPSWVPIAAVVAGLVVVAKVQQKNRGL